MQGVEKCVCNQDDIPIGGVDTKDGKLGDQIVGEVLERLHRYNVGLNLKNQVVYLGLRLIGAIKDTPVLKDVSELRSFLGMVQYYSRFLPGVATILAPLHRLLKKDVQWR